FANGATIRAANNGLYTFTVNTASGSGNDVVLTLASIDAAPALDVTGGQVVYNTPNGVNSDLTVSLVAPTFPVADPAAAIALTAANAIGTAGQRLPTAAGTIVATSGVGGIYLTEDDGAAVTATASSIGTIDLRNNLGTLTVAGATATLDGNVVLSSTDGITLSADLAT